MNEQPYERRLDEPRLTEQQHRVYAAMSTGRWLTLREIAAETGDPEASVSAQLRHIRNGRTVGGRRTTTHNVTRRRRGARSNGLWEYHLEPRIAERLPVRGPISLADAKAQELPL